MKSSCGAFPWPRTLISGELVGAGYLGTDISSIPTDDKTGRPKFQNILMEEQDSRLVDLLNMEYPEIPISLDQGIYLTLP